VTCKADSVTPAQCTNRLPAKKGTNMRSILEKPEGDTGVPLKRVIRLRHGLTVGPAAKLTTGSLPRCLVLRTSSMGARSSLA
jgi:hypothetical protein